MSKGLAHGDTVPFHIDVAGRRIPGGATRSGGGLWRLSCASYPEVVASSSDFIVARRELEKRIGRVVAREGRT